MFLRADIVQQRVSTDWTCAYCGEAYKEGAQCSRDAEHWGEFMDSMTRPGQIHLERGAA